MRAQSSPTLRVAIGSSSLGLVLIAATPIGVRAIQLGDDRVVLWRELRDRFPVAELSDPDATTKALLADVIALVESPSRKIRVPLDIDGTDFQKKVWRALQRIPSGTTTSYSQLAKKIGHPAAARAVGTACGANPVAIVIPCHRVITGDGRISGYRWGVERKRLLLEREAAA